ncbi:MAG TPA: PEP-CTERM sorting domain-containing protein [Rhizomicrobium sp.]|nr:PEP-CTERM sorting domain-containing protein [Rhizomicrobium sp.]
MAALLGLAATTVPASADLTWTLKAGSLAPAGTVYGTVKAHQVNSTTVEITIQLAPKNYLLSTGSHVGIAWDMSVVPDSVTIVTQNAPVHSDASQFTVDALNGNYGDPGFGNFNYAITPNASSGGSGTENSIVFDITKAGGLTLTAGLFPSNGGARWAADIGYNCTGSPGQLSCSGTGVVATNDVPVPEPGTWTMSIAGLAGLSFLMLQRRRKLARA